MSRISEDHVFAQSVFDHWDVVDGDPLVDGPLRRNVIAPLRTGKLYRGTSLIRNCLQGYLAAFLQRYLAHKKQQKRERETTGMWWTATRWSTGLSAATSSLPSAQASSNPGYR